MAISEIATSEPDRDFQILNPNGQGHASSRALATSSSIGYNLWEGDAEVTRQMEWTTVDKLALEIVDRIQRAVKPDRIVLFGSRARGDAGPHSDFDILIVAPSEEPSWRRTVPVYRLLTGIQASVDVVWWTPEEVEEWRDVKSHFISRALREGKVLYEKRAA